MCEHKLIDSTARLDGNFTFSNALDSCAKTKLVSVTKIQE
jgi:hypothetical protein